MKATPKTSVRSPGNSTARLNHRDARNRQLQQRIQHQHPLVQFQQTIGNQAVGQLLRQHAIQAKLTIGQPGDRYEQEADRVADQVMRMPSPEGTSLTQSTASSMSPPGVQRVCAGGQHELQRMPVPRISKITSRPSVQRACPECEEELQRQPEEEDESIQTKEQTGATPQVTPSVESGIQSLKGGGRPLSESQRAFFEPRFGTDFSRVRIHTDVIAINAARSIHARAFAVGNDIAFGDGQYAPSTPAGNRLMAHELTHVLQQTASAMSLVAKSFSLSSCSKDYAVRRQPKKPTRTNRKRDRRLKELAKWTREAHLAWNRLNAADRETVVQNMIAKYGKPFANKFLKLAGNRKAKDMPQAFWGSGAGPKPAQLKARGFRLAQKDSSMEWWVHPSGRLHWRIYTERKPSQSGPEKLPDKKDGTVEPANGEIEIEGMEDFSDRIDPEVNRKDLFGPVIATRKNADVLFGEGDMVLYDDGTAELFLAGTNKSYVFMPFPSGGYVVYGPDGKRFNQIWLLSDTDIPDPYVDETE